MSARSEEEKRLFYMEFVHRENQFRHMSQSRDRRQYELLRDADPRAVEEGVNAFQGHLQGHLSDDPLRNYKYLFVANVALCCRYCMEGGLTPRQYRARYGSREPLTAQE